MVNKGREKELDRDMSDVKKHRKAISTAAAPETKSEVPEIKLPKEDVYAVSVYSQVHSIHNLA